MDLELRLLEEKDLERFAHDMQQAFQAGADAAGIGMEEPVLPRADIDKCLADPRAEALGAWESGKLVGGSVVFLDHKTREHECALLYVTANAHGKGVGTRLWRAIEERYPEAASWKLCTPYLEVRNVHFYLRKCGFHIVDVFEDADAAPEGERTGKPGEELMFSFVKRRDGRWQELASSNS